MTRKNIAYQTEQLARYFENHRRRWSEFYPSEQWIFDRVGQSRGSFGSVLDVGCAVGGLAPALQERFKVERYVGVDINPGAIGLARENAKAYVMPTEFLAADICDCPELSDRRFDLVTALSVVDWNVDAHGIYAACWKRVAPGGHLVVSLRLTPERGVCDIEKSWQPIWAELSAPAEEAERAPYTVFNTLEAIQLLLNSSPPPSDILAYGYWAKPSATARTLYDRLVFTVFAVRKPLSSEPSGGPKIEAHLPADSFSGRR